MSRRCSIARCLQIPKIRFSSASSGLDGRVGLNDSREVISRRWTACATLGTSDRGMPRFAKGLADERSEVTDESGSPGLAHVVSPPRFFSMRTLARTPSRELAIAGLGPAASNGEQP